MKHIILYFLLSTTPLLSISQTVTGIAFDSINKKPIAYAHIYNETRNTVTACDANGFFSIGGSINDTLMLTSVGYYWGVTIVNNATDSIIISAEPANYELEEVKVHKLPTEEEFLNVFIGMKPKDDKHYIVGIPQERQHLTPSLSPSLTLYGPISGIYKKISRKAQKHIKAYELIEDNKYISPTVNAKLRNVFMQISKLSENQIDDFILFCNLEESLFLPENEMLLLTAIYNKYNEYIEMHPDLFFMNDSIIQHDSIHKG